MNTANIERDARCLALMRHFLSSHCVIFMAHPNADSAWGLDGPDYSSDDFRGMVREGKIAEDEAIQLATEAIRRTFREIKDEH